VSHNVTTKKQQHLVFPNTTHHNTTNKNISYLKKHQHHDIPRLLASSGSNFLGEWSRRTSHDSAPSALRGHAIFYVQLINSLFYLLLFYRKRLSAHADKRWAFSVNACPFFLFASLNRCALTSAIRWYIFCRCLPSTHHVRAWFRTRGGGRHDHAVYAA